MDSHSDDFRASFHALKADWVKKDFYESDVRPWEIPVQHVARMWARWCEAHPYGVDAYDGITFMASQLSPPWGGWASDISRQFLRVEAPGARPVGDMAAFVMALMTTMVAHPEGPPSLNVAPIPTVSFPIHPVDPIGKGTSTYEHGGSSGLAGTKRVRVEESYEQAYYGGCEAEGSSKWHLEYSDEEYSPKEDDDDSLKEEDDPATLVTSVKEEAISPPPAVTEAPLGMPYPPPAYYYGHTFPPYVPSLPYYFVDHHTHAGYYYHLAPPTSAPIIPDSHMPVATTAPPASPASPSIEEIYPDPTGKSLEHPLTIDSESDADD